MAQLEVEHGPGWGSRLLRWLGGGIGPDSPAKDGREGIYPQSSSDEALEHGPNQVQQFLLWAHLSGHSSSRMNQDLPNPAAHEKSFSDPKKMDLTLISVDFQMDFSRMNGLLFEVRTFPPSLPPARERSSLTGPRGLGRRCGAEVGRKKGATRPDRLEQHEQNRRRRRGFHFSGSVLAMDGGPLHD